VEVQHKNSPKKSYILDIQMRNVPCRGTVVSHIKSPNIILLIKM